MDFVSNRDVSNLESQPQDGSEALATWGHQHSRQAGMSFTAQTIKFMVKPVLKQSC